MHSYGKSLYSAFLYHIEFVELLPVHRYGPGIFSYSGSTGILGSCRKQKTA